MLTPLVLLLVLELSLRVVGYGYDTSFFVPSPTGQAGRYITNPQFGWRFFPREIARAPVSAGIDKEKPAGTYRVFVLGASAAQGYPEPAISIGRILEVMLQENYPDTTFEVVNTAVTAVNSHVVRLIALECADFDPDLFVVYLGNNEVIGPYGPGTAFSGFSESRTSIKFGMWMQTTKVGQLVTKLSSRFASGSGEEAQTDWQGLEMFLNNRVSGDDPRLPTVYDHYEANLRDIAAAAASAGAGTILCTVPVNLSDCPPFASEVNPPLNAQQSAEYDRHFEALQAAEAVIDSAGSVEALEGLLALDSGNAEFHFRLAQNLAASGMCEEAREHYELARDLDALRFRCDSGLNARVGQVAADLQSADVSLADAREALAAHGSSPCGSPGNDLFYEHVHMTFAGNYAVASSVFEQVVPLLPASITQGEGAGSTEEAAVLPYERCEALLAWTAWDERKAARDIGVMMNRPPFTGQFDHEQRLAAQRQQADALEASLSDQYTLHVQSVFEAALQERSNDVMILMKYAHLLQQLGNPSAALAQWDVALRLAPEMASAHNGRGLALASIRRHEEAVAAYDEAIALSPMYGDAYINKGIALAAVGKGAEALDVYGEAIAINPKNAEAWYNTGIELQNQKQYDEAADAYRQALEANPSFHQAANNLGNALQLANRLDEAIAAYQQALAIQPGHISAHHNMAIAYRSKGDLDQAIMHFREALRLDPSYPSAQRNLEQTLRLKAQRGGG
ncbi:MAG: tetratricopeptide repeat protein [Planctomycetes bacterium]|nr:tetratricopeptide repeat protein [Planctomycetota bacterium]